MVVQTFQVRPVPIGLPILLPFFWAAKRNSKLIVRVQLPAFFNIRFIRVRDSNSEQTEQWSDPPPPRRLIPAGYTRPRLRDVRSQASHSHDWIVLSHEIRCNAGHCGRKDGIPGDAEPGFLDHRRERLDVHGTRGVLPAVPNAAPKDGIEEHFRPADCDYGRPECLSGSYQSVPSDHKIRTRNAG